MDGNDQLSITEEERGPASVRLAISGRIDALNSSVLETRLSHELDAGCVDIVLDMIAVRFLSSLGIRAILKTFKEAKKRGGGLLIADPSDIVKNVIGMTALDEMLLK